MRLHGDRQPGSKVYRKDGTQALFTGCDNEVWSYGEDAYPILKKYLMVRESLREYTRSVMREAHEEGKPPMRPMFYEFPEDDACVLLKDQYMYGGKYLVAPVMYAGMRGRAVYLPWGASWKNIETGDVFPGGQTVQAPAPLGVMPVFERIG